MQQNETFGGELAAIDPDQAEALEPAQEIALAALLAGQSISAAATAAGCHRSTLYRWLQADPRFMARLNGGRLELANQARAELLTLSGAAAAGDGGVEGGVRSPCRDRGDALARHPRVRPA